MRISVLVALTDWREQCEVISVLFGLAAPSAKLRELMSTIAIRENRQVALTQNPFRLYSTDALADLVIAPGSFANGRTCNRPACGRITSKRALWGRVAAGALLDVGSS